MSKSKKFKFFSSKEFSNNSLRSISGGAIDTCIVDGSIDGRSDSIANCGWTSYSDGGSGHCDSRNC